MILGFLTERSRGSCCAGVDAGVDLVAAVRSKGDGSVVDGCTSWTGVDTAGLVERSNTGASATRSVVGMTAGSVSVVLSPLNDVAGPGTLSVVSAGSW